MALTLKASIDTVLEEQAAQVDTMGLLPRKTSGATAAVKETVEAVREPEGEFEPTPVTSPADAVREPITELMASLLESTPAGQDMGPSIPTPAANMPELEPFVEEPMA